MAEFNNSYQRLLIGPKLTSDIDLVMQTPNSSVAQKAVQLQVNNSITEQAIVDMKQEQAVLQVQLAQQRDSIARLQEEISQSDMQAEKERLMANVKANEEVRRAIEEKAAQQDKSLKSFADSMQEDTAMMSLLNDYNADLEKGNQILRESSQEIQSLTTQLDESGQMPSDLRGLNLESAIDQAVAERAHVLSKDDFRDMMLRSQQEAKEMGLIDGPDAASLRQVDDVKNLFDTMSPTEQSAYAQEVAPDVDLQLNDGVDAKYAAHDSIHLLRQLENTAGNEDHVIRPSMAKQLAQAKVKLANGEEKSYLSEVSSQMNQGRTAYQEHMAAADARLRDGISEAVRNGTLSEGYVAQFGDIENMKHEDLQKITTVLEGRLNENRGQQLEMQSEMTELKNDAQELTDNVHRDEQSLESTQKLTLDTEAPQLAQQDQMIQPEVPDHDEPGSSFNPSPGGMSGPGR